MALATVGSQTGLWITEGMLTCAQGAGAQGMINVLSQTTSTAVSLAGYSDSAAQKASQVFYYGSIFCVQFYLQYNLEKTTLPTAPTWEEAVDSAVRDITVLLAVNIMLEGIKKFFHWVGDLLEHSRWSQAAGTMKRISDTVQYASYGYQFYKNSAAETAVAVVTGTAAQNVMEQVCQRTVALFLKEHQKSLLTFSSTRKKTDIEQKDSNKGNYSANQPLLTESTGTQSYCTFQEGSRSAASTSTKVTPDKKLQRSAFIALSIHNNMEKLPQADTPGRDKNGPRKERCCAIL